jgi:hypothetical protein
MCHHSLQVELSDLERFQSSHLLFLLHSTPARSFQLFFTPSKRV